MKTKKLVAFMLVVLMVGTIFLGCSSQPATKGADSQGKEGQEGQLTVGFSIVTLTFPYYVSMLEGFEAAAEEKGWDYIYTDAGMDVEKTINDCIDMISKGVDALVIASWYGDSMLDVLDQAKAADIPVFFIDTGGLSPDGEYVTNIGTVNFDAGYNGGYWAANHFLEEGQSEVNYISLATPTTVGRDRADGFLKGLEEAGLKVNMLNEYLAESREAYMSSFEDALITYPEIDLVFSTNAQGGLGSYDASTAAGRTDIKIVGFDCEDEEIQLIDKETQYIASIMQLPDEMAAQTIQNIEDYLFNNATFEKSTPFTSGVYTSKGALTTEDIFKDN